MDGLTIMGGKGFVGGQYVKAYYDQAIGNITSVNEKSDLHAHSKDILYFISTVDNYNVFTDPYKDVNTNLITLLVALEDWRKNFQGGVFNFISSWFVYGDQQFPINVPETADCHPKGFYSITKRCAELLLISYCETYDLNYRILRLGNVVGPGDKKVSAKKNALQYVLNKLANNEGIEIYGDGDFHRDYIHVEDCVCAIDLVLSKGKTNEIYNIGNGQTWCFKDIITYARVKLSSTSPISYVSPSKFHQKVQVETFYLDNTKLTNLGYTPKYKGEKLYDYLCEVACENLNSRDKC
jgi:nucleoside-diphosphate-sugar epimerase